MIRMSKRSRILNLGRSTAEVVEPLIDLCHEKKAGIGGDLCFRKSTLMNLSKSGLMGI